MTETFPPEHLARYARQVGAPRCEEAGAGLAVSFVDGVAGLERFSSEIDRLNLASARPNPFLSSAFLRCYALRMEYHTPGREERLFLIREGSSLLGCVPMRRTSEKLGMASGPLRWRSVRLQFLAPWDTEQPGILCAPADHERVAQALIRYLCSRKRDWAMLEWVGQPPGSTLYRAVHGAVGRGFRARDIHVAPYNEIAVAWQDLHGYFRSLAKKMRSNISRQGRRLFAAGEAVVILADGARAVTAWFDAYCDLDSRSWKDGTLSSIRRHSRRVRFYREVAAGNAGLEPAFIGIVLDGVLVAGLILGSNAAASPQNPGAWCLEMAYDQSRAALGPGQLLLLLAVGQAIEKGYKRLSFMQNFAYYKHRWGARPIEVVNVQLIRRMSLRNLVASLGDLTRKLRATHGAGAPDAGVDDCEPGGADNAPASADRERARQLTATAMAGAGNGMRQLDRAAARAYLPFDLD